jgi:predicted RNase H-like nuclease (RuvC/YqgF family)
VIYLAAYLVAEAIPATPSSASLNVLLSILAFATALLGTAGGITIELMRRRAARERAKAEERANQERDQRIDRYGDLSEELMQKWQELKVENDTLKLRDAQKDVEIQQLKDMLRNRDAQVDELTRELAVWQYRLDQLEKKLPGGSSSAS